MAEDVMGEEGTSELAEEMEKKKKFLERPPGAAG